MEQVCDVFLAIRFGTIPTKTKVRADWVRIAENPIKHIKRLARINQDNFWNVYNLLMSGCVYSVGNNQYKLFKDKKIKI